MDLNPANWMSPAAWDALDKLGILLGNTLGVVTIGAAGWGFVRREALRRWFIRGQVPVIGFEPEERQRWDAIAFTVSRADVPIRVLERHLEAARVGLIFSEYSRAAADEIKAYLRERGRPAPEEQIIHNPDDPAEARRKTRYLLEGWRDDGLGLLAVDVTGGKTPMSLGAFLAAREVGASTLYVTARENSKTHRPDLNTAEVRCISRPE